MWNEECLTIFWIFIPHFPLQTVHNQIVQEYRKIKKVKKKSFITMFNVKSPFLFICCCCFLSPGFFSPIPTTTRRRVAASISTTSWLTSRSSYRSTTSSSSAPRIQSSTELFHQREQYSLAAKKKKEVSTTELETYTSARPSGKKQPWEISVRDFHTNIYGIFS